METGSKMKSKKPASISELIAYFAKNLITLVSIVLLWRSIWYILDGIDIIFFGDNKIYTVAGGLVLGVLFLYLPDRDLKEIEKL